MRLRTIGPLRSACVCAVALAAGACGGTPAAPSSPLSAPTLATPLNDAIAGDPPVLTVNNASSTVDGLRTYDFQVADSEAALSGAGSTLVASASGIAEGPGGQTTFQVNVPLARARRFYWRARAVQSGSPGPWSGVFRFQTELAPNPPPIIQSLVPSRDRTEVGFEIQIAAAVVDQETAADGLIYEWSSASGTFTGSGASIGWRAASGTPSLQELKLTVIERYSGVDADGRTQTREHRVEASVTVHVNDSPAELSALALTFLDDFVHSERSPEYCVRNFSDNCRGKGEELGDIQQNRARYLVDPSRSSFRIHSIGYNTPGNVPAQATFATVLAPCEFASTEKATGIFGIARGTCRLTNVYENWQWRLCESNFLPPLDSVFDAFSRRFLF